MKRFNHLRVLLLVSVLVAGCSLGPAVCAQSSAQHLKDSVHHALQQPGTNAEKIKAYNYLANLYFRDIRTTEHVIDTVLNLYDRMEALARKEGDIKSQGMARTNKIIALSNKERYEEVIAKAPEVFKFLEANELWNQYYQGYRIYIRAYRQLNRTDEAIAEADKLYNYAKARNATAGIAMALESMASIYGSQRRFEDAEQCRRECIALLKDESDEYLSTLTSTYAGLIGNLVGQKRYEEALSVAKEAEEANRRLEKVSKTPQGLAWNKLWLYYTDIYRQMQDFEKAFIYLEKADSITARSWNHHKLRGHILVGLGKHREAVQEFDKAMARNPQDAESKYLKIRTLIEMGETKGVNAQLHEFIVHQDSVRNMEHNQRMEKIRTEYEVDRHIAEKTRNRDYFLLALTGCVLLLLLLGATVRYNRIITRKNRNLYNRIKEQDRLNEELELLKQTTEIHAAGQAPSPTPAPEPSIDPQQQNLVNKLRQYLLQDNRLAGTDINRDELIAALDTNKNVLSEAVKTITGKTLMEYIRYLQLEEARRMLEAHPELTIEAVAFDCGFNASNTFYRLFKKQYGISPAEYRKMSAATD